MLALLASPLLAASLALASLPFTTRADGRGSWRGGASLDTRPSGSEDFELDIEALPDISKDLCWHGDFTKDKCCRGDSTTTAECWDGMYSFGECCPNADCWAGSDFTYTKCCGEEHGLGGNAACWSSTFTYSHCCLANNTARSWVDVMTEGVETEQFYAMDEFYTDAQYGDEWGYYSKGHVLKAGTKDLESTQQFAHFTTYPMALSPHFGRVFCRLLFVMWINLGERAPFRVVEMGAGSGQLSSDIQQCVWTNALGIAPPVWRRWAAAFEYLIMERSPALAERQRARGLRVVSGDAQSTKSCKPVLKALAESVACAGVDARDAPECAVSDRGTAEASASVVISNELLDAFAPVKLRLTLYGAPNITDCLSWQEVRLVHTMPESSLANLLGALGHTQESRDKLMSDLHTYTTTVFCNMANTTIGQEARTRVPEDTSCLALAFGLSELVNHVDLGVPAASHNMLARIRKDPKFWMRLRDVVVELNSNLNNSVALPRDVYRQLRHQLRDLPSQEVDFITAARTHHVPVTITEARCGDLMWWFEAHRHRIARLARFYASLGYPAVHLVVRPGERNFIDLVDCLLGPTGGFKLSLDYGASFEGLAHSLSIDPRHDGIFVPPIPQELMQDLPNCHEFWPTCAGRIDWTTFVDFTNLAVAGERLGWRTLFYGPQTLLEQHSRMNMTLNGKHYSVPGYQVHDGGQWISRHVSSWYGRETLASEVETGSWVQRWTSFKALLLYKPAEQPAAPQSLEPRPVFFPSWHLDSKGADSCWNFDFSTVPLADWIPRNSGGDTSPASTRKALEQLTEDINNKLGRDSATGYEEAQLAVRMVDWLVATGGCQGLTERGASSTLASPGLWRSLQARLRRKWGQMWGSEALERVSLGIFQRLAEGPEAKVATDPSSCIGQQTYFALCEEPGGGAIMSTRPRV